MLHYFYIKHFFDKSDSYLLESEWRKKEKKKDRKKDRKKKKKKKKKHTSDLMRHKHIINIYSYIFVLWCSCQHPTTFIVIREI